MLLFLHPFFHGGAPGGIVATCQSVVHMFMTACMGAASCSKEITACAQSTWIRAHASGQLLACCWCGGVKSD